MSSGLLRALGRAACRQLSEGARGRATFIQDNILKSPYEDVSRLNLTIPELMWQNLDRWPDKTATVCAVTGHGYTYAQTHKMSSIFAASLRSKLRLREGDVVAVALPNSPEYPCVLLGALQAGCVASTINPAYTAYEFEHAISKMKCKAIVTSKMSYPNLSEALRKLQLQMPLIFVDTEVPAGGVRFAELAEDTHADLGVLRAVRREPSDAALMPFSSGTTGLPKGVVLDHGAIVALLQMLALPDLVACPETTASYQAVVPAVLPFFHIFGLNVVLMNQMYLGCKLVTLPYFKPELFLGTIVRHKATALFIVPPMALFLGKHPDVTAAHLASLEAIVCGAAPLSANDAQAVLDKNSNINFRQGLGMTETSGVISISKNTESNLASVGYPISTTEVRVSDLDTHEALPPGKTGEIWYRGRNVMRSYLNDKAATDEMLLADGWLRTGDIGRFDDDGFIYVTDRLKELIKVKGFQVAPAELEAVLRTHPDVHDCAVVGVPDPNGDETPKAFLVPRPKCQLSVDDVTRFVNEQLAPYKHIKHVQLVDLIPKNPTGKILRKELRNM